MCWMYCIVNNTIRLITKVENNAKEKGSRHIIHNVENRILKVKDNAIIAGKKH